MTLDIHTDGADRTLEIVDRTERKRVTLRCSGPVAPSPSDPLAFVYPVDDAVSIRTGSVRVEGGGGFATVLDESGAIVADVNGADAESVPPGRYYLKVAGHLKTYLRVDAPAGIDVERDDRTTAVRIDFGEPIDVCVGARSIAARPEATITTTADPRDVMAAVSYFGSALKAVGPMRSFPSLRGHPPALVLGDELHVPDSLEKPGTGVTIEVPPTDEYVLPVAMLAYYLGAEVVPGDRPRLVTDEGTVHPLDGPDGFERSVERTLTQIFTCDCYVRVEAPYASELGRQASFERDTGIVPGRLYDRSVSEQIDAYLSVPYGTVEPYVPRWSATAFLTSDSAGIEYLPFLANELAVVRSAEAAPEPPSASPKTRRSTAVDEFVRGAAAPDPPDAGSTVGPPSDPSIPGSDGESDPSTERVEVRPTDPAPSLDAQERRWVGSGVPLHANKSMLQSHRNALDREPIEGELELIVVCNDEGMAAEDEAVRELLGADTPFDVSLRSYCGLRTDELRDLLERGGDLLHFIGHIDGDGFACPDGRLDAATLETVNVDAFFLNACRSYEQGTALVDAGAIAGVVTLTDVLNSEAVETGKTIARLLNRGFPLDAALAVASREHATDDRYAIVGDGKFQVVQSESVAHSVELALLDADEIRYGLRTYVTPQFPLGSIHTPTMDEIDGWYLVGDDVERVVPADALLDPLSYEDAPVRIHGALRWSSDVAERLPAVRSYLRRVQRLTALARELGRLRDEHSADRRDPDGEYARTAERFRSVGRRLRADRSRFDDDTLDLVSRAIWRDDGGTFDPRLYVKRPEGPYPESPSYAVVRAIQAVTGKSVKEIEPLYQFVDPDALDSLSRRSDVDLSGFDWTVGIMLEGYPMTVSADGRVAVFEPTLDPDAVGFIDRLL